MKVSVVKNLPFHLVNLIPDKVSSEIVLMFHGFPGERNKQNIDFGKALCQAGLEVFMLHYSGLGDSKGNFGFKKSIDEGILSVKYILDKTKNRLLNILGHSWGGFVAFHILKEFKSKINKTILLAPFSKFQSDDNSNKQVLLEVMAEKPGIFKAQDLPKLVIEIRDLENNIQIEKVLSELNFKEKKLAIIQPSRDQEVSPEVNRKLAEKFQNICQFIEIDDDHGFQNSRQIISQKLVSLLKGINNNLK